MKGLSSQPGKAYKKQLRMFTSLLSGQSYFIQFSDGTEYRGLVDLSTELMDDSYLDAKDALVFYLQA